ncbi:MAG: DUF4232 domain-containing protein [Chloroflexota bacterium]
MKFRLVAVLAILLPSSLFAYGSLGAVAAPSAAPARCQNTQLLYSRVMNSAGAGHVGVMYRVHNQAPAACTLYGYPGAELLDRQFHSLPTTVQRGAGYLTGRRYEHLVTLSGSNNGYFAIEWVHFPTPGQTCPKAPYIMITAPGNRLPTVTYARAEGGPIDACGGILHVSPIQPKRFSF